MTLQQALDTVFADGPPPITEENVGEVLGGFVYASRMALPDAPPHLIVRGAVTAILGIVSSWDGGDVHLPPSKGGA